MTPNITITLTNLSATQHLATLLAPLLRAGDVLALYGDLGAGKTTFTRFLLAALGITDDVPSPTFTILQSYDTPAGLTLHHFDLYRIKSADDLEEIGWYDATVTGAVVVEWPDRAAGQLSADRLELRFDVIDEKVRTVTLVGHGIWRERISSFVLPVLA